MNKAFRENSTNSYIVLCPKHDSLRRLKDRLKHVWNCNSKCFVCGKIGNKEKER